MNTQTHRLIFSKSRGCLIAVGENARSVGGGGCSGARRMRRQAQPQLTTMQKRLGDGFYEQKLVRDQVLALTGNRFLGNYQSDEEEYMVLMNSGLTYAKQFNLRPGVALTPDQIAQLTSDMVWLVSQEVTLADGTRQSVLVPQVYVRVKPGDLDGTGALLAGADVDLKLSGDLSNSATILGRKTLAITAENIHNLAGTVSAGSVDLQARGDIDNTGGVIQADNALKLQAGCDIHVSSTTRTNTTDSGATVISYTGIERIAGLYVKGEVGTLVASAGRDINFSAAAASTGSASLSAGRDLNLNAKPAQVSAEDALDVSAGNYVNITAGQDVNVKGSNVLADQGVATKAGVSVSITADQNTSTSSGPIKNQLENTDGRG